MGDRKMRVLNTFKVVPELDLLRDKDWTINNNLPVETSYVKKVINTYDESALELVLKMAGRAEFNNQKPELIALTVGETHADLFLKKLLALGFNKAYRVNSSLDLRFNPYAIASIISAFAREYGPFDFIVMGMQSSDGDNAKTALLTAEELAWPCITGVTGFEPAVAGLITVSSISDQGLVNQTVHRPCILAVGNAPSSLLRVPTLSAIKTAAEKEIGLLSPESLNCNPETLVAENDTELRELEAVKNIRDSIVIEGVSAEEKARLLYESYLKGWLSSR